MKYTCITEKVLKYKKTLWRPGLRLQDPAGELTALPRPLAGGRGLLPLPGTLPHPLSQPFRPRSSAIWVSLNTAALLCKSRILRWKRFFRQIFDWK